MTESQKTCSKCGESRRPGGWLCRAHHSEAMREFRRRKKGVMMVVDEVRNLQVDAAILSTQKVPAKRVSTQPDRKLKEYEAWLEKRGKK